MTTKISALSNVAIKSPNDNIAEYYATNWKISQAAPSEVIGSTARRYQSYANSTTSKTIANVGTSVTLLIELGKSFSPNDDFIQCVSKGDATKWMKGNVTASTADNGSGNGSVTFNVQYKNGAGTFADWTVGGTIPDGKNYTGNIKFVGTDSETNFPLPAGSPLFASDTATTQFGTYFIDFMDGFPTNDAAGLAASAATTYEQVTINGETTTAFVIDQTNPTAPIDYINGYRKQTWATCYRNISAVGFADLPRLMIKYHMWINDLTGKFTTTNRKLAFFDCKTGSASQGGDFRYFVGLVYADSANAAEYSVPVGTVGWEINADNNANSASPALTAETFFNVKVFNVAVPQDQFFEANFYWKRGVDNADLTTGRFLFRIKLAGDRDYITVWDQNSVTNAAYVAAHPSLSPANRNIHMGERGNKFQRLFYFGAYGKYEQTNMKFKCAKLSFHGGLLDQT